MCTFWRAEPERSHPWHHPERNRIMQQFICACADGHRPKRKTVKSTVIPLSTFSSSFILPLLNAQVVIRVQRFEHKSRSLYNNDKTSIMHIKFMVFCAPYPFSFSTDYAKRFWGTKGTWVFYPLCQGLQASRRWNFHVYRVTPWLGLRLMSSATIALEEKAN